MKSIFDQATKVAEETQVVAEFGVTKQIAFGRGAVWAQELYEEELNRWRDGSIIAKLAEAEATIERVRALLHPVLGGTPTGELAEICGCGTSYLPCDHAAEIIADLDKKVEK